jgi:PTS system nitrogen regulatory IIA component
MDIADILGPQAVFARARVASKKALLEWLSGKAAKLTGLSESLVFETILERERLNTTGMGQGVAIPHGRIPGLKRMFGLFVRLEDPVDFESIDDLPVDLVFLLLAPPDAGSDHLKALARVARLFRNQAVCEKLRASADATALFSLLTEPSANAFAA